MKKIFFIFVLLGTQLVFFAGTSGANPSRIEYEAGLNIIYSDNVIYTYVNPNSTPSTNGDFIYRPYVAVKFKTPGLNANPARIDLFISDNIYNKYSAINFQTYSLLLEQKMDAKTFIGLTYTLIPFLFAGEEDILSGASTIDTSRSLRVNALTATFDKNFSENKNFYLYVKYTHKDYNAPLEYRTAIARTFGGDLTIKWNRATTIMAGLSYETNEAEKGMVPPTPPALAGTFDDFSYTAPGITLLFIQHLSDRDTLRFRIIRKNRSFTADPLDRLHDGVNTRIYNILFANAYKITPTLTWKLSYELNRRDYDRVFSEFTENRFLTGVDISFK
jgi:hypothetical protein